MAESFPETDFLLETSVTYYRLNNESIVPRYLYLYFSSSSWYKQASAIMQQTTKNQVIITKQALFYVALPPLDEQRRIVDVVDKLIPLCEGLKERLNVAQGTQVHLADAIVAQALA